MKLRSLAVQNFLSFDEFHLDLADGLGVIVGPNGSGKTNLVRALMLAQTALSWSVQRQTSVNPYAPRMPEEVALAAFAEASHTVNSRPISVELALTFDTDWEQQVLTSFVRAAVLCGILEHGNRSGPLNRHEVERHVHGSITTAAIDSLFRPTLVVSNAGHPGALWRIDYRYTSNNTYYNWVLTWFDADRGIWVDTGVDDAAQRHEMSLTSSLYGVEEGRPIDLTALPPFRIESLCSDQGKRTAAPQISFGTGAFDLSLPVFVEASELLDLPTPGGQEAFGLQRALTIILADRLVILGEHARGIVPTPTPIEPTRRDGRSRVARSEPGLLPLRLFELRAAGSQEAEYRYSKVLSMFEELAPGRSVAVTYTAPVPGRAQAAILDTGVILEPLALQQAATSADPNEVPAALICIVGWHQVQGGEAQRRLPIGLMGAGTWEALVVAEAIAESPQRVTVLDEPGLNLHPSWQQLLRTKLAAAEGQFLVLTHSADLVPMQKVGDLTCVIRMTRNGGSSARRLSEPGGNGLSERISQVFGGSADARSALFARAVVIVEGDAEFLALPIWCTKYALQHQRSAPDELDLVFLNAGGGSGFRPLLRVLNELGIPWYVWGDGKMFDLETNWSNHIFRQLKDADCAAPEILAFLDECETSGAEGHKMTDDLFSREIAIGVRNRVLTTATSWCGPDEALEALYLKEDGATLSKPRRARRVAEEQDCPESVGMSYATILDSLAL